MAYPSAHYPTFMKRGHRRYLVKKMSTDLPWKLDVVFVFECFMTGLWANVNVQSAGPNNTFFVLGSLT